jgi:CHAT domain-containing protein/tetratricopeptide (TPR) repeat protein
MYAGTILTVFKTAAMCLLLLPCANCRKEEPTKHETSQGQQAIPTTAESSDGPQRSGPSHSAWWSEGPVWYRELSAGERVAIDQADNRVEQASRLWRAGELNQARDKILGAQRAYKEALGDAHWKTWDTQLQGVLIQAEQAWDDRDREAALALGLKHLVDDDIGEVLARAADPGQQEPAEAGQRINAVCDLLRTWAGPPYGTFFEAYREYYYAWAADRRREYAEAQEHFECALGRLEELIPFAHPWKAHVHYMLSQVTTERYGADRQFPTDGQEYAKTHVRVCLQMLRDCAPVDSTHARDWDGALHSAGQCLRREERYGEAKFLFSGAVAICRLFPPKQPKRLSIFLLDLAEACNAVGDGYAARSILDEIEGNMLQTLSEPGRRTRFLVESGVAHLRLGEYEQACEAFQRALDTGSAAPGRDPGRAPYYYGAALTKMGQFGQAAEQYEYAMNRTERPGTRALAALFALRAKIFELAWQREPEGLRDLAGQLEKLGDGLDAAGAARRQRLLAYARLLLDQPEQAMRSLEDAAANYEQARSVGHLVPFDLGSWHENESPYLLGAIGALRLRAWDKAFEWLERHSAQALDSLTQQAGARATDWPDVLSALGANEGTAHPPGSPTGGTTAATVSPAESCARSELGDALLADGSAAVVGWVDDIPEPGRPALPDHWVFALYQSVGKTELAFVQVSDAAIAPEEVSGALTKPERSTWRELAYRFYQQRFAPIMPHLTGVHRLYVLSRGLMLGFPVEVLPLDDPNQNASPQLLGDRFAVAYGPSCSTLQRLKNDRQKSTTAGQNRILAIGDAKTPDWPLPASRIEAESVARYFGSGAKVLLGASATESALYSLSDAGSLQGYSHLHFAVHARAEVLSPEQCYLELTGPGGSPALPAPLLTEIRSDDGTMRFREITGLKLGNALVVLSACETARGRPLESEGYMGLPHAFFHAGARAMISTLWPVGDVSTALLMDRFYSNLIEQKMSTAEALQDAKRHLRRQTWSDVVEWCTQHGAASLAKGYVPSDDLAYDHPRYWASFVLIGPHD